MPHNIFIQGNLGAGKTLSASIMAHYYRQRVESLGGTLELFSNYGLKGSHPMDKYQDWFKVAEAQGSVVVWDEAHRIFDSRTSTRGTQVLATHVLTYARKMKSIQIFVSPSILNVDTRVRQLTEVLINVRRLGNHGMRLEYFDYQAQNYGPFGKFLNARFISQKKLEQIYKLKLYDTDSFVFSFPLPNTERLAKDFFEKLEETQRIAVAENRKGLVEL